MRDEDKLIHIRSKIYKDHGVRKEFKPYSEFDHHMKDTG